MSRRCCLFTSTGAMVLSAALVLILPSPALADSADAEFGSQLADTVSFPAPQTPEDMVDLMRWLSERATTSEDHGTNVDEPAVQKDRATWCQTMVSPLEFMVTSGQEESELILSERYLTQSQTGVMVATIPASALPNWATLRMVCYQFLDSNPTADFLGAIVRFTREDSVATSYLLPDVSVASAGTLGRGIVCGSTDSPILRVSDLNHNGRWEFSDYIIAAGSRHPDIVTDGSIAVGQVLLYWESPAGWPGPCDH